MANGTGAAPPKIANELLKARTVITYCLEMLRSLDDWAEGAIEVARATRRPAYADQLDGLRDQIKAALQPAEMGTPAALRRAVAELAASSQRLED